MKIYFLTDSIELTDWVILKLTKQDLVLLESLTKEKPSYFVWKTIVDKDGETHSWIIDFLKKKNIVLNFKK